MALYMGLVEPENKPVVLQNLIDDHPQPRQRADGR